jgi:molybdate transport system substrate-binding protein
VRFAPGPRRAALAWLLALGVIAPACRPGLDGPARGRTGEESPTPSRPAETPRLLLYCGAGIRPAADEIVKAFEKQQGLTVECDYDGSERLLSRIKLSGLGDVYMPGDVHYVEQAAGQSLVASYKNACYFVPVILVQKGNPKKIESLADLTRPGIDLGLGNPEACAIGRQSISIFEKNHIALEDVQRNLKFQSLTVNDLGNHIKLDQLDAVIVWDAMAAYFVEDGDVVRIPSEQNIISTVAAGLLTCSRHPELARKFVDFIASDEGAAIFERHHYTTSLPESD